MEHAVPVKVKTSKKLISKDLKSNISNFKYTNLVEICPLCKDDLLYLPKKIARNMGNIPRLVLVKNVTNVIHLIDPLSGQTAQMSPETLSIILFLLSIIPVFWRDPITPIITAKRSRFTRYVILGREPVTIPWNMSRKSATTRNQRKLASLTIAKEIDLGVNDICHEIPSHIGYLLKAGDVALGYDLRDVQLVNFEAEQAAKDGNLPDIVVLRKLYGGVATQDLNAAQQRIFCLQKLDEDVVVEYAKMENRKSKNDQYMEDIDNEDFLREVEADKEMRVNINIYKSKLLFKKGVYMKSLVNADKMEEDNEDDQKVSIDELLDRLDLDTSPERNNIFIEGMKASKDGISYIDRQDARQIKVKDVPVSVGNSFRKEFIVEEGKSL